MKPLAALDARSVKVVLLDIDDTLTTSGKLTAEAYGALEELKRAGKLVVPVTGRPAAWCDHIARMWPVDAVVGENGAFYFRLSRGAYDTSDTAPARWAMLGPWLAGFVAYQLTAPTVLSAWPGWESFWRHGQDLLHVSATNGFSASLVALAVAALLTPLARLASRRDPVPLRSGSGR